MLTTNIAAGTQKTYNLTLENTAVSGETPLVHLYNISGLGEFDSASDSYLVGSPALADSAVAVAAWVASGELDELSGVRLYDPGAGI